MLNRRDVYNAKDEEDEEGFTNEDDRSIQWSNIIFLPFHPTFKFFVLISVIIKSILGPIQSVYPIVYCWDVMDRFNLHIIKYIYCYCCDPIYAIDTFLHMVHRQVTDKAMRREYLPKPSFLLLIDIVATTPLLRLHTSEPCLPVQLWPNILSFNEFIIIYRIGEYFSIVKTHSYWKLCVGFTLIVFISINCVACFFLLLTSTGLCRYCNKNIYDWRKYVIHRFNGTDENFATYVYAASIVFSYVVHQQVDEIKASTYLEFIIMSTFAMTAYLIFLFIIFPKMFAENHLSMTRICTYRPIVQRIIQETQRRNPSPKAYLDVKNFYSLIWKKRGGITFIPEVISELPKYLRIDIRQDLVWPIFYHSPTFRRTSISFKRWICEHVRLDYKLPGERFFAGPQCYTNLYYLKTGIVQFLSVDDGVTPLISVTSGTVFGDISFFLPRMKRNVIVRCLTYCEVLSITRLDILISLHMYPNDRRMVMENAKERIKHARTLYTCKQHVRGLDRSEDEGIDWVKRRWWQISNAVSEWKRKVTQKDKVKCELPPEEAVYHCAKYIGQLVLCTEAQLQLTSMFTNVKFPWIFAPQSGFGVIWRRIVVTTVYFVVVLYPPCLTRLEIPIWFKFFQCWTDIVYAADIFVSLLTSTMRQENTIDNFIAVMFARCKSTKFVLDLLSTVWIENLAVLSGIPDLYYPCQFNRLIKIYVIFPKWNITQDPFVDVCHKNCLIHVSFMYFICYLVYILDWIMPDITTAYFFGNLFCEVGDSKEVCHSDNKNYFVVFFAWIKEFLFYEYEYLPNSLLDLYIMFIVVYLCFLAYIYCETNMVAALYLKHREKANFQYFVSNIQNHYRHYRLHHDLLRRLHRYLVCHWKYYRGMDVMHPELLKNEPYDIWFKVHGEVAENTIKQSSAFISAHPAFIKELAYKAKFLLLPKHSDIFLFGKQSKTMIWIIQGYAKCDRYDEKGDLLRTFFNPGDLISSPSVLFGFPSLRTVVADTDCEILYIKIQDFFAIIKHYPAELSYLEYCMKRFNTPYKNLYQDYTNRHKIYETNMNAAKSQKSVTQPKKRKVATMFSTFIEFSWLQPQSSFINIWMLIRAVIVAVSITSAALQGGSGAPCRKVFMGINITCDILAAIDIVIKMFLGYYDKRGLLITDKLKCVQHYLTHGFVLDLIGILPIPTLLRLELTKNIDDNTALLINTLSKFAHLYLLTGYLDYYADTPSANMAFIKIFKWQVVTILMMLGAADFFISKCIQFHWNIDGSLSHMSRYNSCWLPRYLRLKKKPSIRQLHMVFAESLNFAQSGLLKVNLGRFRVDAQDFGVGFTLFVLGCLFWYVTCYSITLLILNYRGNTLFQHGVSQLREFLKAERVEKKVMDRAIKHFIYWWVRTKGINIQNLMNERIGIIFRQDLSQYLFNKTFKALNIVLEGIDTIERDLCSEVTELYFLPGEEILREMDLAPWIYIVHRGSILLKKNDQKIALLTKGAIFGQVTGAVPRPVRISAQAYDHADVLQIPYKVFQDAVGNGPIKKLIEDNPQSQDDYIATDGTIKDDPYNTVQYLLRGIKSIKLPWHTESKKARNGTWYLRWLFVAWYLNPTISTVFTLYLRTAPPDKLHELYWSLVITDIIHFVYMYSEFFTMELVVEDGKCVERALGWRLFKRPIFYLENISVIYTFLMFVLRDFYRNRIDRLSRLCLYYHFQRHFCTGFKSRAAPILLKITMSFLIFHSLTCTWMYVACDDDASSIRNRPLPAAINHTVDYSEWLHPDDRTGGCARVTRNYIVNGSSYFSFLVPRDWRADYIVAMSYILIIYTQSELDSVIAVTTTQMFYKVFINIVISITYIWILSVAMSSIYTKLRNLYRYDCGVIDLLTYLDFNGLSPVLLKSVREYTKQLWKRQKGNWLPELAHQAPQCLREDILSALYIHHLQAPPVFRDLPLYFIRQLVTRLHRVVVFPGKYILQEGDIYSAMYFIHEGEVEKYQIDKRFMGFSTHCVGLGLHNNGEQRLLAVLTANGYFGLIPGLFPTTTFRYSYYARTVVDVVVLRYRDWQDLLHGYPQIKQDLYAVAKQFKV